MVKTVKKWLIAAFAVIFVAATLCVSALAGCTTGEDKGFRPESPSVSEEPPKDASPDDYSALENVAYVIGKLASRDYFHSRNTNTASATALGFITVSQNVVGSKDYKDGILITSTISTNSSSLAPSKAIQKYFGNGEAIIRTAASSDRNDWNGLDTEWSQGEPSERLTHEEYEQAYGLWATEFSDYVINEKTVTKAEQTKDGENYSVTLEFAVSGENDATYYYKRQMVTMGDLSALPKFNYARMTVNFTSDWSVSSYTVAEEYISNKGIISATVTGSSKTVFSYKEEDVDVSAYEEYFKKYESEEAGRTPQQYLEEGLASILDGRALKMTATINGAELNGYASLKGKAGALSQVRLDIGGAQLTFEDGDLYITYGGINAKIDLSEEDAKMAILGDSYTVSGDTVTVNARFSAVGLDIGVSVVLNEKDGVLSPGYIQGSSQEGGVTASIMLEPSSDGHQFASPDKNSAVDITSFADDLLNFIATGSFTAEAQYQSQFQTAEALAVLSLAQSEGQVSVEADIKLTLLEYEMQEQEEEAEPVKVQSGAHYVHVTYKGGMLYASYSVKGMDADTALKLKVSTEDLSSAFDKLSSVFEFFGVDLTQIDFDISSILPSDPSAAADASLEAGGDEDGNNFVSLSLPAADGTLGIKLTAAKNNAPAVQAPADADAYIDFAPLAAFAEELRGTAMQMMFGYDLTLSVDAKLFGMMTLADVDISAKIGADAQGQISVIVTINVNAGGGIFFGDTQTQLVIRGGNVYITRTQTSVYGESLGSTDDTPLETPVTSSRAMTMAYFTANIADQLYYALNVNEETLASLISLGEMMGGSGEPGDVGEMITFAVTEGGYSLGLDLGKMLGMNNSTVGILVNCGEVGGTRVITSVGIEASVMGLVSANISLTNNNPGQAVDMSSAAQTVGTIASAFGCADEAALNALIASDGDGFVTDYPVDDPADEPAAEQAA